MSKQAYNLPNLLTYARILAVPLIVLCFFTEGELSSSDFARWSALLIFVAASVTDYLDGYLARIWEQTSNIGKIARPDRRQAAGIDMPAAPGRQRDHSRLVAVGRHHHPVPRNPGLRLA